ncbi:integrase core domain-containing protein [Streptomyces sviceus]|uniref:integrase core domain-containing protein n=1 Tax=Streptomyces sviceus TaxID=285530 RepID=UPI0036E95DF9
MGDGRSPAGRSGRRCPHGGLPTASSHPAGDLSLGSWLSIHQAIKRELLDTRTWPSLAAARIAIFDFVEGGYNLHRLHSSLGYRSPVEYETARILTTAPMMSVKEEQAHFFRHPGPGLLNFDSARHE